MAAGSLAGEDLAWILRWIGICQKEGSAGGGGVPGKQNCTELSGLEVPDGMSGTPRALRCGWKRSWLCLGITLRAPCQCRFLFFAQKH